MDEHSERLLGHLIRLCEGIAGGASVCAGRVFDLTREGEYPEIITRMAEAFGMMLVRLEAREFQLEHKLEELEASFARTGRVLNGMVLSLVSLLEYRDPYTAGHSRRVTGLACAIAGKMGFDADRMEGLRTAGLLHDIGKIAVPLEILSKPGRITDLEFNLIQTHPRVGHDILASIEFPWPVARFVLQHHRRFDGSGYPGPEGPGEIHLEARILAVADVVEAMASHRPYRPSLGIKRALDEIERNRGTAFDPEVTDVCIGLLRSEGFTLAP